MNIHIKTAYTLTWNDLFNAILIMLLTLIFLLFFGIVIDSSSWRVKPSSGTALRWEKLGGVPESDGSSFFLTILHRRGSPLTQVASIETNHKSENGMGEMPKT